jgi:hypothetical protein
MAFTTSDFRLPDCIASATALKTAAWMMVGAVIGGGECWVSFQMADERIAQSG